MGIDLCSKAIGNDGSAPIKNDNVLQELPIEVFIGAFLLRNIWINEQDLLPVSRFIDYNSDRHIICNDEVNKWG